MATGSTVGWSETSCKHNSGVICLQMRVPNSTAIYSSSSTPYKSSTLLEDWMLHYLSSIINKWSVCSKRFPQQHLPHLSNVVVLMDKQPVGSRCQKGNAYWSYLFPCLLFFPLPSRVKNPALSSWQVAASLSNKPEGVAHLKRTLNLMQKNKKKKFWIQIMQAEGPIYSMN